MIERPKPEYRSGIGTDIHELVAGRRLMLGGVHVPYAKGLAGHSDGDVAIHAVVDALLGAAGMGDIGTLFPDTDEKLANADSKGFLAIVKERLEEKEWEIANVDLIIHAEEPKLEQFKGHMKRCISGLLGTDFTAVNVKAKTNEGFGDVGAGLPLNNQGQWGPPDGSASITSDVLAVLQKSLNVPVLTKARGDLGPGVGAPDPAADLKVSTTSDLLWALQAYLAQPYPFPPPQPWPCP